MTEDPRDNADLLERRASQVLGQIKARGWTIATAESCTGGLIASLLTDIQGLSGQFERGFVTYSNEAKSELLGIPLDRIEHHGAVSAETARAMAAGALAGSRADIVVAVTGFADEGDEPGLVFLAAQQRGERAVIQECHFGAQGRAKVRRKSAEAALGLLARIAERQEEQAA